MIYSTVNRGAICKGSTSGSNISLAMLMQSCLCASKLISWPWTMLIPKIIFLYVMKWLLCLLVIHISQICKFMHLLFLSIQLCFTDYWILFWQWIICLPILFFAGSSRGWQVVENSEGLGWNKDYSGKACWNLNGVIFMYESIYIGLGKKGIKGKLYTAIVQIMKGQGC